MKKRLLTGLLAAGVLVSAAFTAWTIPAAAQQVHVQLPTGEVVPVDVPPGTDPNDIQLPVPIVEPTTPAPAPTTPETTPAPIRARMSGEAPTPNGNSDRAMTKKTRPMPLSARRRLARARSRRNRAARACMPLADEVEQVGIAHRHIAMGREQADAAAGAVCSDGLLQARPVRGIQPDPRLVEQPQLPPARQHFGWWALFEDNEGTRYALGQWPVSS